MLRRLAVFCGSSSGVRTSYIENARAVGRSCAELGIEVVYGGAKVGLMGALADSALESGGKVIGVIPEALSIKEVIHTGVQDLRVVASMHERKAMMAELSDGFIALPGGVGTLEEITEVWTWAHLGIHRKPCGLLNWEGFFDPLQRFFDHVVDEGFMKSEFRSLLYTAESFEDLLLKFRGHVPPAQPKWMKLKES